MDWSKGIEAKYYGSFIDKDTWRDMERFEITGGSIKRSTGDLIESADIECKNYTHGEQWIRIWMDARQNGATEHIPMFTGLATSPEDSVNGNLVSNSLECYSVLKPLQDILLPRGWYAPQGAGETVVRDLLSKTPAPVYVEENTPRLKQNIIAEESETYLSMLQKVILALDWRIRIKGDGTVQVVPYPKEISGKFSVDYDTIKPEFSRNYDWYKCPNVFRAVSGDDSAVAIDDSIDSPLSTVNRGREIWSEETSCNLNIGETLYEYAQRRLKESQMVATKVSYDRRYDPNILVTDYVTIDYAQIKGTYCVTSQSIEIGYGANTTEEAIK